MAGLYACRLTDKNNGGGFVMVIPQSTVYINGLLAAVVGSELSPHKGHKKKIIVQGDSTVFVEGIPLSYVTCLNSCGHVMVDGSTNVVVGGI